MNIELRAHASASQLRSHRGDDGFILVSTLIISVLISLFVIMLLALQRSAANDAQRHDSEIKINAATDAGIKRMVLAFAGADDPLRRLLVPDGREARWDFSGTTIVLRAQAESGKVDVNAGDREHIGVLAARLVEDTQVSQQFLAKIDAARATRSRSHSIASLLSPLERMLQIRDVLEAHFTVMTNQRGIDPHTAAIAVLETIPGLAPGQAQFILRQRTEGNATSISNVATANFVSERPIYTFYAEAIVESNRVGALRAVIGFSERGEYSVYSWIRAAVIQR